MIKPYNFSAVAIKANGDSLAIYLPKKTIVDRLGLKAKKIYEFTILAEEKI